MGQILKLANRTRRKVMLALNRDYVKDKLRLRKGKCLKCGQCCRGCKFLDEKTKLCKVYAKRPWFCHREFPIDKIDKKVFRVKGCGYKFD